MKQHFILISLAFLCSCTGHKPNDTFIHLSTGIEYQHFSSAQDSAVKPGETLVMHIKQIYNDSVLSDTRQQIPLYQAYDSASLSKETYKMFSLLHKGDSMVFKVAADSAFKDKRPPFVKKNLPLITTISVLDILGANTDVQSFIERDRKKLINTPFHEHRP